MPGIQLKTAVISFVIGNITGRLVSDLVKPVLRASAKKAIALGLEARKLAAEAVEEVQDLAAEASAEATTASPRPPVSRRA